MLAPILVTDYEWFEYLAAHGPFDEVNFWRPSDLRKPSWRAGTPALFKLKKPYGGMVVGYGIFARHELAPAWHAWEAFGDKNGAEDLSGMLRRIERLRKGSGGGRAGIKARVATVPMRAGDYVIGCLMISQPIFLPREAWVRAPAGWPENAVQGKSYDLEQGEGARVWREVLAAAGVQRAGASVSGDLADRPRYGDPTLVRPRLGQGTFRLAVTAAYDRACAVTHEHSLPALEAAHIRPFAEEGTHEVSNGLLLRSDIHRLFDKGYVGVTPEYRFVVSKALKEDFENGKSYYPLHGREIWLPENMPERPDVKMLGWHIAERFRA
ncbi:MAG: HNH endonuclease [Candidatus Eisenbacteria bacterium]